MKIQQSALYQGENYGVDEISEITEEKELGGVYRQVLNLFAKNADLFMVTVLFEDTSGCEFKKIEE
jgi:hypothetical protein